MESALVAGYSGMHRSWIILLDIMIWNWEICCCQNANFIYKYNHRNVFIMLLYVLYQLYVDQCVEECRAFLSTFQYTNQLFSCYTKFYRDFCNITVFMVTHIQVMYCLWKSFSSKFIFAYMIIYKVYIFPETK